jgi:hypothetical protein
LKRGFAQFDALPVKIEQSGVGDVGDIHDGTTVPPSVEALMRVNPGITGHSQKRREIAKCVSRGAAQ